MRSACRCGLVWKSRRNTGTHTALVSSIKRAMPLFQRRGVDQQRLAHVEHAAGGMVPAVQRYFVRFVAAVLAIISSASKREFITSA
jgi:hypothetical protein